MARIQYKYNLRHFISFQPQYWTIEKIARELEKLGIPRRTFDSDKSIELSEDKDIPGERLYIYANLFDTSIEMLINYQDKIKVKPLNKRKLSTEMQKLMERNDLKLPEA